MPLPGYNIQSLFRVLPQHTVALRCAKALELPQNGFLRGNQACPTQAAHRRRARLRPTLEDRRGAPLRGLQPALRERGSVLVATNLPFDEWTEVFGSERLTGALLDRLTHRVHILEMNGESYRLKQSRLAASTRSASDSPDA